MSAMYALNALCHECVVT